MAYQILLVEPDFKVRELIGSYFTDKSGGSIQLTYADDGISGLEKLYEREYDLLMLDEALPKLSGFQLCQEIRRHSSSPVIFLIGQRSEESILKVYQYGGDDYVAQPLYPAELYAKTNALLRRSKGMIRSEKMVCGSISLSPYSMVVCVDGKEVHLPNKEYQILKTFMEQPGRVFNREQLLVSIWGYDYDGNERVVDNHIKKLRRILGDAGAQISTIIGQGYRLTGECETVPY